jgi:hypothetical protein
MEVSKAIGFCIDEIEADILCANRATDFSHSLKSGTRELTVLAEARP